MCDKLLQQSRITEILADIDPMGLIRMGAPKDEYWPEALALSRMNIIDPKGVYSVFYRYFYEAISDEMAEKIAEAINEED